MDGRAFLVVARRLIGGSIEADGRTATGRAYYALLLESRTTQLRWGLTFDRRDQLHATIRNRFIYASDRELKSVGFALDDLVRLRNEADYPIEKPGRFATARPAERAVLDSGAAIALLDEIEADPARRASAIASLVK